MNKVGTMTRGCIGFSFLVQLYVLIIFSRQDNEKEACICWISQTIYSKSLTSQATQISRFL